MHYQHTNFMCDNTKVYRVLLRIHIVFFWSIKTFWHHILVLYNSFCRHVLFKVLSYPMLPPRCICRDGQGQLKTVPGGQLAANITADALAELRHRKVHRLRSTWAGYCWGCLLPLPYNAVLYRFILWTFALHFLYYSVYCTEQNCNVKFLKKSALFCHMIRIRCCWGTTSTLWC